MTVWVVTYLHRHGQDTHVASSEERALAYVRKAMEEWLSEVPDADAPAIRDALARGNVRVARTRWEHAMPDECFYIDDVEVDAGL